MKRILATALPILALTLTGASVFAQEAIQTGDGGAPPSASVPAGGGAGVTQTESDEAWAKRVLADATVKAAANTAQPDAKVAASKCATNQGTANQAAATQDSATQGDTKPHGEVWASVGSRGYRDVGGVVTQPLGPCGNSGSVTLMVDHAQFGSGHR